MGHFSVKPRLLVIELHHLGDAVMSLPFMRGAAASFELHILCRPASADVYRLLANPPVIHEWIPPWSEETSASPLESLRAARIKGLELASHHFTATACAWADPRTTLLAAATGATRRLGFPTNATNFYAPHAPGRQSRLLLGRLIETLIPRLTHPLQSAPRAPHIERWTLMAASLGFDPDFATPWIPAPPPAKNPKPVLGIHRHARLPTKQWPMEKWAALLASQVLRDQFDILEITPPTPANELATSTRDPHPTISTPDLPSLLAALSSCDAILCHDSLPAHLAAALGKPVTTIFGSGEPDWFAPWNNRQLAVHNRICPLHPCIDHCGMDHFLCLDSISPADVLAHLPKPPRS